MVNIEEIFKDKSDVGAFHDAMFEATGQSYGRETLIRMFKMLSSSTQHIANEWTMGDTVFRDEAYTEIQAMLSYNHMVNFPYPNVHEPIKVLENVWVERPKVYEVDYMGMQFKGVPAGWIIVEVDGDIFWHECEPRLAGEPTGEQFWYSDGEEEHMGLCELGEHDWKKICMEVGK